MITFEANKRTQGVNNQFPHLSYVLVYTCAKGHEFVRYSTKPVCRVYPGAGGSPSLAPAGPSSHKQGRSPSAVEECCVVESMSAILAVRVSGRCVMM